MRNAGLTLAAGATAALLLAACGGTAIEDTVHLEEDAIVAPASIEAGVWTIDVVNDGDAHHNLTVCRSTEVTECTGEFQRWTMVRLPPQARDPGFYAATGDSLTIGKGWDTTVSYDLEPGEYRLWCAVIGHASAGMQTHLTVTDAA